MSESDSEVVKEKRQIKLKNKIIGLKNNIVEQKRKLGLRNSSIDSYSPSVFKILFRNIFSVVTVALIPLMISLFFFGIYREVFALLLFIFISSIINTVEEVRVKNRLERLKNRFQSKARVIREGVEIEIKSDDIVEGDYLIAREGDSILADGEIIECEYLQIDESALTGESDYIKKEEKDEVKSGSFVITGYLVYKSVKVGNANYLNQLSSKASKYNEQKSRLEGYLEKFIYIFTVLGITIAVISFVSAKAGGYTTEQSLLGVTSVIATSIPQTLLVILVLTYLISVTRLAKKGILIQKRGSIDDLATIDVVCIDKTGTITTNEMRAVESKFFGIESSEIGSMFLSVKDKLYGQNRTLETILNFFANEKDAKEFEIKQDSFDQIPFTSIQKYSAFQVNGKSIMIGALVKLEQYISEDKRLKQDVLDWVDSQQRSGRRVIVGIYFNENITDIVRSGESLKANGVFAISIEEELNPGITNVLKELREQNIMVKVISGDSFDYVSNVSGKVGLDNTKALDMSTFNGNLDDVVLDTIIFARTTPDDKANIIIALQKKGLKVSMIGDGINDVIGLKQSNVGIAMESGAKAARDVSDIVLLKNDYTKIPDVFFEGDNIVFNLKLSTKIFFARSIMISVISIFFAILGQPVPILPTSTLIFSFIGNTLAGYILTFTRQKVRDQRDFIRDTIISSLPSGIIIGSMTILLYNLLKDKGLNDVELNTALVLGILGFSLTYTLFLLWDSKKIPRNYLLVGFTFIFGWIVGMFETLAPIYQIKANDEKVLFFIMVTIGVLIVYSILDYATVTQANRKAVNITKIGIPLFIFIAAMVFPARAYFSVDPVSIQFIPYIIFTMIIGIILTVGLHRLILDRLIDNK